VHDDAFREYERATNVIIGALLIGLLALPAFALQASALVPALGICAAGLALVGAGFAIGAVIGFLFGIPRRLQEPSVQPAKDAEVPSPRGLPWAGNTSLEQISDWLTKIIVGVGLTQLLNLPTALASLGSVVGPALGGFPASASFGTLAFVYFAIGGFFTAYLWTSLRLTSLLVSSEEEAKRAQAHEVDLQIRAIEVATDLRSVASSGESIPSVSAEPIDKAPVSPSRPARILWVDDRPSNNAREMKQLKEQGFEVTPRTDSSAALADLKADPSRYDVVITDLKRGSDRQAGYRFLQAAGAGTESMPRFVVYTLSSNPEVDAEAKRHGAMGGTNSPIRLFELVNEAIRTPRSQPPDQTTEP
jgi:CheY-like chemotaxis protein